MPNPRCFPSARRAAGVATWLAAAALAGCASLQPPQATPGQTEAEVVARLGPPTGRYTLPAGGQRLEYATGPYGRTTVMVDLGGDGRVTASQQVLTEANFAQVGPGMSRDAVLLLLGRPADKAGEFMNRQTWSWRYPTYECLWVRITFEPSGRVRGGASYLPDPRCDADQ
ncbi:MAG: outer membrane protein assembly factor BamE [Burkholderiaceae bacterium]|jgi:hypothetical protein|nr:outer membrane protein assembly factor BamE [Burkholderiaceae bacterium]